MKDNWKVVLVIILTAIAFLALGFKLGTNIQSKADLFGGKTAQQWEKEYQDFADMTCSSSLVKDIISSGKKKSSVDQFIRCEAGIDGYRQYLIENPLPTPTPEIIYKTQTIQQPPVEAPGPQVQCKAYQGTNCVVWQLPQGSF